MIQSRHSAITRPLQYAALFEVLVQGNDLPFDPGEFHNSDTGLLGWKPVFLSVDGQKVVHEDVPAPASLHDFRVAFYIQDWVDAGQLVGPTCELELPSFEPVPMRLWTLAPYSCVD